MGVFHMRLEWEGFVYKEGRGITGQIGSCRSSTACAVPVCESGLTTYSRKVGKMWSI